MVEKAVPFDPEQAKQHKIVFYSLPQDLDLEHIDPLMRPVVERINSSGWVWTAECCQGHPDFDESSHGWDHNTQPFLRLVTSKDDFGEMLARLARSMKLPNRLPPEFPLEQSRLDAFCSFTTHIWRSDLGPWEQVNVYVGATNVLQRNRGIEALMQFANALHD